MDEMHGKCSRYRNISLPWFISQRCNISLSKGGRIVIKRQKRSEESRVNEHYQQNDSTLLSTRENRNCQRHQGVHDICKSRYT